MHLLHKSFQSNFTSKTIIIQFFLLLLIIHQIRVEAQENDTITRKSGSKIIVLNLDSSKYQSILNEKSQSIRLHSGLVNLRPNESVGFHNTKDYEEMIVVLEGEGKMIIKNKEEFNLKYGIVAYCSPNTEHNVKNTGSKPLKYIYIVTKTK